MQPHQLINQDSGSCEWFTPQHIIEAARRTMGSIELDPFSSKQANERVRAERIYTKEDDGLAHIWDAETLWMNHPFSKAISKAMNRRCIDRLVTAYECRTVQQACCITFAATSEAWFQPLLRRPQCFLSPRTNYHLPDGTIKRGVTKGSVVTYFGDNIKAFAREFAPLGEIKLWYPSN